MKQRLEYQDWICGAPLAAKAARRLLPADLPLGAHLTTPRLGYVHHGIYVGNHMVVHCAGLFAPWPSGLVEEVTLEYFAAGSGVSIRSADYARYSGIQVAARARSRLGGNRYRLIGNHCERFCQWCLTGRVSAGRSIDSDGRICPHC
jgi:hypothetical protein